MTKEEREEAINYFKNKLENEVYGAKYNKLSIEALEMEICEDCISRQAAIDSMYALCATGETLEENPWRDNPHIDAITDALDNLQPVIPQQKYGKWIKQTLSVKPFGEDTVLCDQCAFMTDKDSGYNYCPNCGAKMESEEINENNTSTR
jgi:Zn finger protein HypA/HybF involved in hydrogenase expression